MTNEDIIRMAREAEFCDAKQMELNIEWTCVFPELQRFANLAAAAERDRLKFAAECFRVCEYKGVCNEKAKNNEVY
jgi:hypothetical protein